jgi:hypothetical protein
MTEKIHMKVRTFLKTSLLALLVATVGAVSAQDSMVPCLNLSADDCAYISTALENGTAALGSTSFQEDFTVDAVVSGRPDSEDAELHLVGTGPVIATPDADFPLEFGVTVDMSMTDGTTPQSMTLEARLVDGILYVQNPEDKTWAGVKAEDALNSLESQVEKSIPANVNPMDPSTIDLSALGLDKDDMAMLMELPKAEGFLDASRDGETFTFTVDLGTLLKSTEWTTFVSKISPKLQQNPDMKTAATLLPLMSVILPEAKLTVVEVVDPSINAVTEMSVWIDGAASMAMMGGGSDPIKLSFKFNVKLSDIGGDFSVEAPADAKMQEIPAGS